MNDARRRSVMQPAMDPLGNTRSGIPVPATVKKPTPNPRMSLAGPVLRAPFPAPPSTNPRHSMFRSQNSNPLLQSTSKPNYGKTPLNNSARRGSIWAGGATANAPGSQPLKDPRPLRDRNFQSKERTDIVNYLQSAGLDITMQRLVNIQSKDYRAIFEYLVQCLDPAHPIDPAGRFEDSFVLALKSLRYPYAHQMDTKWLAAVGSPHSWPMLLGVLHWLVELCKMKEHYLGSSHPTLQEPSNIAEEFDDPLDHRALAFDYYEQSYIIWLDHVDDFVEPNQRLEERYAKKNARVQKDLESQSKQLDEAKIEYNKLKLSAAPVAKLQNENKLLNNDSEKFQKILRQYEARTKKLIDSIALERAELGRKDEHLAELKAEQHKLGEIIKEQNLSAEEASRMTTDYENLSRNIEDLKQKIADTHRVVMTLEVNVHNRASSAEEALDLYTSMLSSLGLFPPLPPPLDNIDLTLELNTAAATPQQLLSGADIRKVVKPTLNTVAESKRSERAEVESERIRVDNELDQLTLECENIDEEVIQVERKALAVNEQADDLHNAAQQDALVASEEARRLEKDLAHARTAALANGMGVKSRLQKLQFDYREQIEKVNRLKDETVRAIIKNSHDIAMFKSEVARCLRELRECAEMGSE